MAGTIRIRRTGAVTDLDPVKLFRCLSELIAIAKARVWASEGWVVVISDGKGKIYRAS
jgi:hypothetical protein